MRSCGGWRWDVFLAIQHGTVVLAIAAALLGQASRAQAGGFSGDRADHGAVVTMDATNVSLKERHLKRTLVCCGMTARPIPPLLPGDPPTVTEDTGVAPAVGQGAGIAEPLWDAGGACGAGVGMGNLAVFWSLCALGLTAVPRGWRLR
ncbi:MAG: hypothetical protein JSU68_01010 [Phycisphaerales bacterium]|nr:MAG: hypothetical protein JSU68_01010 [Phycisphaerales bacterium]